MDGLFHEILGNPPPPRMTGGFLTAFDGRKLRYACFRTEPAVTRGTVILLPGRNESIEKYFETGHDLNVRGFTVAIMDWRGQGGSERLLRNPLRGHVGSFDDYVRDLDQFFEDIVLPDCRGPYYVMAHSTGALIALLALPSLVNRVRRMVLISPFLTYTGYPLSMKTISRLSSLLYRLGLGRLFAAWHAPRRDPFKRNKLTNDPSRYRRNQLLVDTYPKLAVGGPTVSWVRGACKAVETVSRPEFIAAIPMPILFIGAGSDQVVSTRTIAAYAQAVRGGTMLTITGARHEILQERDLYREQLLAAFDAFVPGTSTTP